MANHEINEEQEAVNKALRMIETSDPVHADVYNALFSILINNDVFLEKLANKMVQQVMISHVMDSTNPDMVMGANQGPVITKLIEKVQEQVNVLNTNRLKIKICTYSVACYVKQDGALPYRSDGIDLSKKADYPTGTVLIVPLAAYYLQKHAVMAITSNTWLNISGDNLTYTCAVAYFYI